MNNSEEKAPPNNSEREGWKNARIWLQQHYELAYGELWHSWCDQYAADYATSKVIRALKDAADRVCPLCEAGEPLNGLGQHAILYVGPRTKSSTQYRLRACMALNIHAQIAALRAK